MLFNDFFLLTRVKRPLITKILQILHRTIFYPRGQVYKPSLAQSNMDWFDTPEGDHVYLTIYKKVSQ
jgi:hypothetical protein